MKLFDEIYHNKRILITGHTGFKGSWLSAWLMRNGAQLCGIALAEQTVPSHYNLLTMNKMQSHVQDIRDYEGVRKIMTEFQPEIIFHLAAQPLVRYSYAHPLETFQTNVMGTANLLEAARKTSSVRAFIAVTSDKCYENRNLERGYTENDPMGGYDPYSASKGCSELVISSYLRSFFNPENDAEKDLPLLASVRAGNVIGGGDWADDRLIPDLMRAAAANRTEPLRNPSATRPWQHVLESLSGYLLLGQRLLEGKKEFSGAWNFGPDEADSFTVLETAQAMRNCWNQIRFEQNQDYGPHEAVKLKLNCEKAHSELQWFPVWKTERAFQKTAEWYRDFYTKNKINTFDDLDQYLSDAEAGGLIWTK